MAQVVLDHVYKQFPQRSQPSPTRSSPVDPSPAGLPSPEHLSSAGSSPNPASVSVLRDINLTVNSGEFLVLVGPSGCGKSTLLRLIAGLEPLTAGDIWINERKVTHVPPKQRDVAMVFQSYALYPHMTVLDNLAFGLRRMGAPELGPSHRLQEGLVRLSRMLPPGLRYQSDREHAIQQRVHKVARMLQIEALLARQHRQLSGGQKQRVALGRAIARDPQVFLMDEPLSNLDAQLRTETRGQIADLQGQLGTTTIYVTHDQIEAMTMGDRIAVMNQGQLQQVARPLTLYHHPANRFVAEFIGTSPMNFLQVEVCGALLIVHPAFRLTLPESWQTILEGYDGRLVWLGIRPEHLSLAPPAPKNLSLLIERVETLGSDTQLLGHLTESSESLQVRLAPTHTVAAGHTVWLSIDVNHIQLFDLDTEQSLQS